MTTEEMTGKIYETEQRSKSNTRRIEVLEKNQEALTNLTVSVEKIATRLDTLSSSYKDISSELAEIKGRPGKWWEALITALIAALVGAVIGYIIH